MLIQLGFLNIVGYRRRKELEEIKSVINAIRKNKISDENEIVLPKFLEVLEKNIKAMFHRTKTDLAKLEHLAEARSNFLGYVSHELRTPIFAIQGYLETLLNGAINDPKVNLSFVKKALNHSNNLNTLLNDLIDISMIESGLMKLSFRYIDLNNFLSEVVNEVNSTEKKDGVNLVLTSLNKNVNVAADKDRLKQVMINLINNAFKYTNAGTIEIIAEDMPNNVIITVKDSGIGIRKEEQKRIFERFYRTERDRQSSIPGTGLGLSIVKHILEAHKTSIIVKSELHKGSEFSFKLRKEIYS